MSSILLKNAVPFIDGWQPKQDILLENGIWKKNTEVSGEVLEIDANGAFALPALFAIGVDFQEPAKDNVYSFVDGFEAMRRGGFSGAFYESNANPIDDLPKLRSIQQTCANSGFNMSFLASFSYDNAHKNISEMLELSASGAAGFGDGGYPVGNLRFLRMALEYGYQTKKRFFLHPLELSLCHAGVVNEGIYSDSVGFKGIPEQAETIAVYQILELAKWFGTPVHLREISCAKSLEIIANARNNGVDVSCDVGMYHLLFDDSKILSLSSEYRFNSPLRTEQDKMALWEGLLNGKVQSISVNHFPVRPQDKQTNFEDAMPGALSLEIALSALWNEISQKSNGHPEKIFDWMGDKKPFAPNEPVSMILFNPECEWEVTPNTFAGEVNNSPLLGKKLKGKIIGTYLGGVWKEV